MRSRRGTGFPSACPKPVAVSQCSNITPLIVDVTLPLLLSTIVSVSLHRGWQSDKLTQYHKKPTRLECEGLVQNVQAFDSLTFSTFEPIHHILNERPIDGTLVKCQHRRLYTFTRKLEGAGVSDFSA
ncbi:uncharacterized protein LACBIDRAFT_314822 [Laccaria bicolor S238N-H82]|uniref:Predicted protein n=1 Tax=Laccaria bicolor (strain S238N-H82 / ATCC MYA-4686) TaxID=486041 RepID=B0DZA8_LACBS|nr:uncharacterized protein LACBIDRAFT_314822 [Laccaria bicolor S238N-H82]EDR00084.1 predicted protein [Laccaria bicolor S238N-H82]|eukprot:XP_001889290.1 predicted protein [Laccaria bicolor S238N-H82]